MTNYIIKRFLRGVLSVILVTGIVMVLIYSCLDRNLIFANDPVYTRQKNNAKEVYKMQQWENYGYVTYVSYADFLLRLFRDGQITREEYDAAGTLGDRKTLDSKLAARFTEQFTQQYLSEGYQVIRLDAKTRGAKYQEGGEPRLFAYRDVPVLQRLLRYITGLVTVDSIHYVQEELAGRGLTFTLYDPAYGGEKFSPAILGMGTYHRYLLYFDDSFPYIHQNFIKINMGASYSVNAGVDVYDTMTNSQGSFSYSDVYYPSGVVERSADDLHSATYVAGSLAEGTAVVKRHFTDDYTNVSTHKNGQSKLGYSFTIGILAVLLSYLAAIPLGIAMARHKDGLADRLGTLYIIFILAVPSLAYIFLFKSIGGRLGLPTTFDMESSSWQMYLLPVISLALPAVANLTKWLRRYMIDQKNADYVKFARAGGLSEGEIFRKHILRNAIIPIAHGIPASILGALTGAIITERVYVVPGAGNLLTTAINLYDNGVIVGMTLFYAVLSVASVILGDILISVLDPRISFVSKER